MITTADALVSIKKGDLDVLTAALDSGTDPNATDGGGWTLLMIAVVWNKLHIVDVLLSRGANIHLKDCTGSTALHLAAGFDRTDVFRKIFSVAGPRAMNFPNCHGWTPLHSLTYYGSAEIVAFALSHPGMDISIQDALGRTPLDVCSDHRTSLQTYGDQEARWQPLRSAWIKLLYQHGDNAR
jgi:ankyrin repeat protein